jgi:SAM-dependent methyltransferase
MKKPLKFDFERALAKGHVCYDGGVGQWWESQAADGAHKAAYRAIAEYIRDEIRKLKIPSPLIVDYACGGGFVLLQLAKLLPEARLVGLDGSNKLLALAQARLEAQGVSCASLPAEKAFAEKGPRVRLIQTRLPNFKLPQGKADAVAFVFPNIAPAPSDQPLYDRNGYKKREDVVVGKMLARFRETDPEDEVVKDDAETLFDSYMTERVLSRNIRGLLHKTPRPPRGGSARKAVKGGLWFKVDYANALRSELSELSQQRCLFCEGALEVPIKEKQCDILFTMKDNKFRRSQVIMDVYHQTKDESDKTGGYFITLFEGV